MNPTPNEGELRPDPAPRTSGDDALFRRLRWRGRPYITPEECRVPDCDICRWRRAGLLNPPDPPRPPRAYARPRGGRLA